MSKKTTKSPPRPRPQLAYRLRRSPVHGTGLFATRAIRKGASIIEYLGERISHEEADRRHAHKAADDNHTFLFTVDSKTVIDGGSGGNAARFINHSCEPNCEVIIDDGRLLIEALRAIRPGEELVYDYRITRDSNDPPDVERIFACRCGTPSCRGTMLAPRRKRKPKRAASSSRRKPRRGASTSAKRGASTSLKRGVSTGAKRGVSSGEKRGASTSLKRGVSTGAKRGASTGAKRGVSSGVKRGASSGAKRGA
ncbi:MAG: SET domain-containing protein-lysine N-methyltransferase, partial [Labilithrix sp.]|nr:SET domain-containing protein-lysine N-methyltransferase [Labilithrix sp.]